MTNENINEAAGLEQVEDVESKVFQSDHDQIHAGQPRCEYELPQFGVPNSIFHDLEDGH